MINEYVMAAADALVPGQVKEMATNPEALKAELAKRGLDAVPDQYKGGLSLAQGLYADPAAAAKSYVPAGYEGYADQAVALAEKAADLKKQKDALQLKAFEKAIDPLWIQYDPENTGYCSKDSCGKMVE